MCGWFFDFFPDVKDFAFWPENFPRCVVVGYSDPDPDATLHKLSQMCGWERALVPDVTSINCPRCVVENQPVPDVWLNDIG